MASMAPISQSFTLTAARCISAVSLKCKAAGNKLNDVLVQIRTMSNGFPSTEVVAEAFVPGTNLVAGAFFKASFNCPVFLSGGTEYAIVVLNDDPDRSLAIATIGRIDTSGKLITTQPFTVGVLMSSSNGSTWTAHQDSDLVFMLHACVFTATEKTVTIGTFKPTKMSDIIVSAGASNPTASTSIELTMTRPDGSVIVSDPKQTHRLSEFIQNETIEVKATLKGTASVTPYLYPGVQIVEGELQDTGTYVSREMTAADADKLLETFNAYLPTGSGITVEAGPTMATLQTLSVSGATNKGNGVVEQTYVYAGYPNQDTARTRLTIAGTPAARPYISGLRMISSKVA